MPRGRSSSPRTRPTSRHGPRACSRSWPDDDGTRAILARTNRELRPAVLAALALGQPFRAPSVDLLVDDPAARWCAGRRRCRDAGGPAAPGAARRGSFEPARGAVAERELAAALLAWAPPYPRPADVACRHRGARARLAELRRDDARLSLATAHSTKGAEFDHVAVVGMEEGRFPSGRAVAEAEDPSARLEEERRLGYVAWTRARRTLTLSYDPAVPSPFLLEAFAADELGVVATTTERAWNRLISRISRSIESRNGSVTSGGKASRTESFGPYAARARMATERRLGRSRRGVDPATARGTASSARRPARAPRRAAGRRGGPRSARDRRPPASSCRAGPRSWGRQASAGAEADSVPVAPSGGARSRSGRRLRSEPLTRIRNE